MLSYLFVKNQQYYIYFFVDFYLIYDKLNSKHINSEFHLILQVKHSVNRNIYAFNSKK